MNNMGGLRKLWYIDAEDFVSLVAGAGNLYTLTLVAGTTPEEIEFTMGTGRISEQEDITDNGILYNFETSCRIPKCGPDNTDPLDGNRQKKLLILGEDENENLWLAGSPGSYFNISLTSGTGENQAEMNSRQLRISAGLPEGCVFINPLS